MRALTRDRILTQLENGVDMGLIARRVKRPVRDVRDVAGVSAGEKYTPPLPPGQHDFVPSRRQIAAATREIRRDWSDETRQLRETIIPFHSPELIR